MRRYRHTEIAWVTVGILGFVVLLAAPVVARSAENLMPMLLLSGFLLTPLLFFGTYTVAVTGDDIVVGAGVGLFPTRIPVNAVRSYERVRGPWYSTWSWSTDLPERRMFYNATSFQAVELLLVDGTRVRIGTNEPEALLEALRHVVPVRAVPGARLPVSRVKPILAAFTFLLVPGFVLVALMFYVSTRPVTVTASRDQLSVSGGIYRDEIPMKDVVSITLEPVLPVVLARVNAFRFGDSLRGRFLLQDAGEARLFVERDHPPYVKVRTKTNVVWINFMDPERTRDLHATLIRTAAASR